jgi:hypothetical protein
MDGFLIDAGRSITKAADAGRHRRLKAKGYVT